jgi:hypothetical protein
MPAGNDKSSLSPNDGPSAASQRTIGAFPALPTLPDGPSWHKVREFIHEATLIHPPHLLAHAAAIMVGMPLVLAWVVWLSESPSYLYLVLLEPLLLAVMASYDLSRRREGARRFAMSLGLLNYVFAAALSAFSGNLLLVIVAASATCGVCIHIWGRQPRHRMRWVAWLVFLGASAMVSGALVFARAETEAAAKAYAKGDFKEAGVRLERAAWVLELRGGSEAERALLAFRRAELALHGGDADRAERLWARADALGMQVPVESGLNPGELERTLAWSLVNGGSQRLAAATYCARAWGDRPDPGSDLLGAYEEREFDRLTWMQGFRLGGGE